MLRFIIVDVRTYCSCLNLPHLSTSLLFQYKFAEPNNSRTQAIDAVYSVLKCDCERDDQAMKNIYTDEASRVTKWRSKIYVTTYNGAEVEWAEMIAALHLTMNSQSIIFLTTNHQNFLKIFNCMKLPGTIVCLIWVFFFIII